MSFTLPATRLPVEVYTSAPGVIYDSISVANQVQDWPDGTEILFFVRQMISRTPALNGNAAAAISPPDQYGNNVSYEWQPADITALGGEGDCAAWWRFTIPGLDSYETPEFPVILTDHGPGFGTQTGVIVDGAAAFMPISLNALRQDDRFGDRWLQQQATVIEYRTLGYAVAPDLEASSLHPVLVDYLSKRLALGLTKPAIEFWSRQWKTMSSTQTSEVSSYPDMIATLKQLKGELVKDLIQEWRDLLLIVPGLPQRKVVPIPQSSIGAEGDPHHWRPNTKSPREMPPLEVGGRGWGLYWGIYPFP